MNRAKYLCLLLALTLLLATVSSGCQLFRRAEPPPQQPPETEAPGQVGSNWNDGEYRGEGQGYGGPINVVLTINDGRIDAIDITQENETEGVYERAFEEMPGRIIEAQSTEVEVVSGATRTSQGIIEAVNEALEAARQQ